MTELTLYGDPRSTYVRTARMACHEKGVDYTLEPVEFTSEGYRALHPFNRIPAMRHGDLTIYETAAIGVYIDGSFEGPPLHPANARDSARMVQWISAVNDYYYDSAIMRYVLQYVFPRGADGAPDRTVIDAAVPEIRYQLSVLDRALADGPFLLGAAPLLADLFLAPILFYLGKFPESAEMLGECSNVGASTAAMETRPSFTETMPPLPG